MELFGRVLWWSDKDENGIIVDTRGNEFYFDRSVIKLSSGQKITANTIVTFNLSESIKDCLCARNVQIPVAKEKKLFEEKFQLKEIINN